MEMPDVLKYSVWKFNITNNLMLNNHSKYLMCASTALQTSLKHIFFEEMHKHMNFNCLIIPAGIIAFYNHFGETMKILLQSEP